MTTCALATIVGLAALAVACGAQPQGPAVVYLSDVVYGISTYTLDYGRVMGIDTTAYPLWPKVIPGEALRIAGRDFAKGIGAPNGEIRVMLDGEYELFETEVGVQEGSEGVSTFTIVVDGVTRYQSGSMTAADAARPVRIDLKGAQEMRLMGHGASKPVWADAKLTRSASASEPEPADMAPFARVVTFDPRRAHGVTVHRLTEFPAADVFLETDLAPSRDGSYNVPFVSGGEGCIGLQWLERRRLREVALRFAGAAPSPDGARVEAWVLKDPLALDGYSEWQGRWAPIKGAITGEAGRWVLPIASRENREVAEGTLKIRWILPPAARGARVAGLQALTTARWQTVKLKLQAQRAGRCAVEVYNGEVVEPTPGRGARSITWDAGTPLYLTVRATRPRPWGFDRTVLRFRMKGAAFGVAVDDVVQSGVVYVRHAGLLVSTGDTDTTLDAHKTAIAQRRTVLAQVRQMPDQTLAAALKAVYIPQQNRAPTLLSLGCDNRKVIAERTGAVGFGPTWLDFVQQRSRHQIVPLFGTGDQHRFDANGNGENPGYHRTLAGGWMPIPIISVREAGVTYRQTVCVAPADAHAGSPTDLPLPSRPMCVVRYDVESAGTAPADASLELTFLADAQAGRRAAVRLAGNRAVAEESGAVLCAAELTDLAGLAAEVADGALRLRGRLAPGASARLYVYAPMQWSQPPRDASSLLGGDAHLRAAEAYWQRFVADAIEVDVPDELLGNIVRASQAHCLIASRSEEDGRYIDPWISSTYYASLDTESHAIIRGMDLMGHPEYARRAFDFFIKRQDPAGFMSHGYTLMGTGQHSWFLADHFRLTGDRAWWDAVSASVARICDWVLRQTGKTRRRAPDGRVPQWGLAPPGTVADWQDWGYIFSMEGYYCAGLANAAAALALSGHPAAARFARGAAEMRRDIRRAYAWTQAKAPVMPLRDGSWVPGSPYQLLKPGPCEQFFPNYSGAWLYDSELGPHHLVDQGVLDPHGAQVDWMADQLEDSMFLRTGMTSPVGLSAEAAEKDWFNVGGFPRCQPYYGRYPELCALRDDVKPFIRSYFGQLAASVNREDLAIYENPGASVWNKTHETGHFLQQTRLMLLMERGDELWLAPFTPNHWLRDGGVVRVERAPTFFGPAGYRIVSRVDAGVIEAQVKAPTRTRPSRIVLRLRHPDGLPIRSATARGADLIRIDRKRECVVLRPRSTGGVIEVRAQF